ncbi:MAG TPA: hypothetical protein DCE78_07295 [Bacteroidetes bacterium]|nr:hypothetical protein [Bacteroidota bacterium]
MTTTKSESQKINILLPITTIAIGLVLLTYMITVESEPGAIPLLLILVGTIWFFVTKSLNRKLDGGE